VLKIDEKVFGFNLSKNDGKYEIYVYMQGVRKVAVHLKKVLEVMSTSVYTRLEPI